MSAEDIEELLSCAGEPHQTKEARNKHPSGFEPGVKWEPGKGEGTITVPVPPGQDPRWQEELARFGFEGLADVLEVVEVRAWESPCRDEPSGVKTLHYVKARCRKVEDGEIRADVDALCEEIAEKTYTEPPRRGGDWALVVPFADWQAGKGCAGGPAELVKRVAHTFCVLEQRIRETEPPRLILMGMGDLVEGCSGWYPEQEFRVVLNRREQCKLVRRLWVKAVERLAPLVPEVLIGAVAGNHGEHRGKGGKSFTDYASDNDDVATVEQAAEVIAANPAFKHVSAVIPDDTLTITLDVFGTPVAFTHAHQSKRGGPDRVPDWWRCRTFDRKPEGDCSLLLTGHYHHLRVRQAGAGRFWIQCPSLDGDMPVKGKAPRELRSGSKWWTDGGGSSAAAATLALDVGRDAGPFGWGGLELIA